jgi:hypothetical protein
LRISRGGRDHVFDLLQAVVGRRRVQRQRHSAPELTEK